MSERQEVCVGIDVSKAWWDVAVSPAIVPPWRVPATAVGLTAFVSTLLSYVVTVVVVDASGGYEEALVTGLVLAEVPTFVLNPSQVRDYARAMNRLAKTDRLDAALLADFAARVRPAP